MKILGIYAFAVGQLISLASVAVLLHVILHGDTANHHVYSLVGFALFGQLPLLFILRTQLATTGQTVGEFLKTTVVPLLPWGKKDGA